MNRTPAPRVALFALLLVAVAATASAQDPAASGSVDDSGVHDPWEGMNRGIFSFNEGLDRWFLEPVATGWDFVFPDPVENSLKRFFQNLGFPVVFLNDLLQAKPIAAAQDVGRFLVNTTVGVAGLFDPATHFGLPASDEDFGQTLGVWGVPPGPYLVLPLLGPSSPRDTGGLIVDLATPFYPYYLPWFVNLATTSVNVVNRRSLLLETIREERAAAFDFYVAVRNAHVQRRANQVSDNEIDSEEGDDDLYDVEPVDEDAQ
jgi:phospholipid-binding lipoprotein MlaA